MCLLLLSLLRSDLSLVFTKFLSPTEGAQLQGLILACASASNTASLVLSTALWAAVQLFVSQKAVPEKELLRLLISSAYQPASQIRESAVSAITCLIENCGVYVFGELLPEVVQVTPLNLNSIIAPVQATRPLRRPLDQVFVHHNTDALRAVHAGNAPRDPTCGPRPGHHDSPQD